MSTAYNLRYKRYLGAAAGVAETRDPGSAGTVNISSRDHTYVQMSGAGARTLPDATATPISTTVLCLSQTDGVTVNGVALDDGGYALFRVVPNAAGTNVWVVAESVLTGTKSVDISALNWRVHDAPMSFLAAGAGSNDDLGVNVNTYGTTDPDLNAAVDDISATQYGRQQIVVPQDYVPGTNLTLVATVTEVAAADTSATVDFNAYRNDAPSTDLVATAAQSVVGASATSYSFTVTGTNVEPGDILDVRIAIAIDDSAGTSATADYDILQVRLTYSGAV